MKKDDTAHFMNVIAQHKGATDACGKPLYGSNLYRMPLPAHIPSCYFLSDIIYDNQTRLMISKDQQWPSIHINCKNLMINQDGPADAFLVPQAPDGIAYSWVNTIHGKGWNLILRLYSPQPDDNKSWRPGEIEEVNV